MTEEEAKTKWCPYSMSLYFTSDAFAASLNRGEGLKNCNCIGSQCMAGCDENGKWLGWCGLTQRLEK